MKWLLSVTSVPCSFIGTGSQVLKSTLSFTQASGHDCAQVSNHNHKRNDHRCSHVWGRPSQRASGATFKHQTTGKHLKSPPKGSPWKQSLQKKCYNWTLTWLQTHWRATLLTWTSPLAQCPDVDTGCGQLTVSPNCCSDYSCFLDQNLVQTLIRSDHNVNTGRKILTYIQALAAP